MMIPTSIAMRDPLQMFPDGKTALEAAALEAAAPEAVTLEAAAPTLSPGSYPSLSAFRSLEAWEFPLLV